MKKLVLLLVLSIGLAGCTNYLSATPQQMDGVEEGFEDTADVTDEELIVVLAEVGESGQYGQATVVETVADNVEVTIEMDGTIYGDGVQPVGIYKGDCTDLKDRVYELNDITNQTSITLLDVTMEKLMLQANDLSLVVWEPMESAEREIVTSCGTIR